MASNCLEKSAGVSTCFTCTRLNATTFRIVEDDEWRELPFIYAKVYDASLVLVDTGCGGASRDKTAELTSLRTFLETYPVADNGGRPLNPCGEKKYVVICTHCHFDHIGGIEEFSQAPGSAVWASSYDKDFLSKGRLPASSLCRFIGMQTPAYDVTGWADDGQPVTDGGRDLGLVTYHTPGHVPDQMAIWDAAERVLFVGDTAYEWVEIVFPLEGDLKLYSETLVKLTSLVRGWNAEKEDNEVPKRRVTIACGHVTCDADAETLLGEVDELLYRVAERQIEPKVREGWRDEPLHLYLREDGRLSLKGPPRLFDELRSDEKAMEALRRRHASK